MKVLVIAAHPDDEILGCGGTVARHVREGDEVETLIVAEGATSRGDGQNYVAELRLASQAAAKVLGSRSPRFLALPDNRLDSMYLLDIVQLIEAVVSEVKPKIVYTHFGGDLNIDHQIVSRAVVTACRPVGPDAAMAIYAFETVSSTEWQDTTCNVPFSPNRYVDIAGTLGYKVEALEQYSSEMRPFPHARSYENVKALASLRGGTSGLKFAEAFMTVREIV